MVTKTKAVHLFGKPNLNKLKDLQQVKKQYKERVNFFIEKLITNPKYYLALFNNDNRNPKIRKLEKNNRVDLGSAYGQSAIDKAVTNLHNLFIEVRNKLYGEYINQDTELYFISSFYLLNACLNDKNIVKIKEELNDLIDNSQNKDFYQECLNLIKNNGNQEIKNIMGEIKLYFNDLLKTYRVPYQNRVTLQLDSRICKLKKSENIKAPYVIEVKAIGWGNWIEIPLMTSSNSIRRLKQYKNSLTSPQLKILKDGKIKVSVAIKKQVKQKTYKSNLVGVDVGITDLIYTSNEESFETYSDMDRIYQDTVGQKVENRRNLANKMRQYQKELQQNVTSDKRKKYLRKKIYNISRMLQGKNKLNTLSRSYYHRAEKKIAKAVNDFVEEYKDKKVTVVVEDLDIINYDDDKDTNRKFSSWARGKLLNKLMEKLDWQGIDYKSVDPAFTSQLCSRCFNIDEDNRDGKSFICNVCGYQADADANASQNIKTRAFDKEVNKITKDYRYNKYLRHQKLKELYKSRHQYWLQQKNSA